MSYIDGITFPSVENKHRSWNYALHPDFVNSDQLELQEVLELKLTEKDLHPDPDLSSVRFEIIRRGIFKGNQFDHWEVPNAEIFRVIYNNIEIKTFNGLVFSGAEVLDKIITTRGIRVAELVDEILSNPDHKEVVFSSQESDYQFLTSLHEQKFSGGFSWTLNHGNEIDTFKGSSCIEKLSIPLVWVKNYRRLSEVA